MSLCSLINVVITFLQNEKEES